MSRRDLDLGADVEGPSLVRPYALVGGRTRTGQSGTIPVEAIVVTESVANGSGLLLERGAIVRLCRRPHSVAEVSGLLELPVGVARVLVADLSAEGFVHVHLPPGPQAGGAEARVLLERVLAGLEAL